MKKILFFLFFFSFNLSIFCQDNRIETFLSFIGMDINQLQEKIPVDIKKDSRWDFYEAKNYPEGSSTIFFFDNNKVKSVQTSNALYRYASNEIFDNYFNEFVNKIIEAYGKPVRKNENSTVISWNRFYIIQKGNVIYEYYQ